jgi:formylmethanofuran dehydrogenase subunit B
MKVANLKTNTITAACTVTCPSCGLLCDDVLLENNNNKIKVLNTSCKKSIAFFEQPLNDTTPLIKGKPVSLQQAVAHAAKLLKTSQQPLFAGLSTDVQGFRAVYNLAQITNGSLQHVNAQSNARNLKVLQSTGWQTTTLTEVKNRADVIVCFGDIATHNPRFFERFIDIDGLFIKAKNRQVILINDATNNGIINSDALEGSWILGCRASDMPSITIALRALVAGKTLKATEIAGITISDLQKIADKLKAAKYAVLAWVAKDLDFPHAELTIQNITETVAILNQSASNHSGRAAGLPLGGSDGDTTANNANTWLSGFALNDDAIEHDLMIWVNSLDGEKWPPTTKYIVLGNCNYIYNKMNEVFIPIATPGLDCGGTMFRIDSSVILPLKKVRENALPTLAEVVSEIEKLL